MITTAEFLRIVALILGIVAGLLFLRALIGSRRASRAAYYSTRREARRIATRFLSTSLILFAAAGGMGITSMFIPSEVPHMATNVKTLAATPTLIPQPTIYIVPTSTPTQEPATPTPEPTLTVTPYVTISRTAAPTPTSTPAASGVSSGKFLFLRAICNRIDAGGQPITSTAEFTSGVSTVYIFFDYTNVPKGTLMRQTWFLNGGSVHFDSDLWSQAGNGTMSVSWSPKQGFEPGLYEVRVLLGDIRQFSANFIVH